MMIQDVIRMYQSLKTHPDMKNKLTDNKRLFLATLLAGLTGEQEKRYWDTVEEIDRTATHSSELKRMRHIAAAFLSRGQHSPNQAIGAYHAVETVVKEHRITRFLPTTQVVITVLLTLQQRVSDTEIDIEDRVTRLLTVYREWRKLHRFLTSGRLLPFMTIAVGLFPTKRPLELVHDVETNYLQLVQLGMAKNEDTVRFAWALLWSGHDTAEAHRLHSLWLQSFKANKFLKTGVFKQAQTLSLLGVEPHDALDLVLYHFEQLSKDAQFRWHSRYALLHPAVQTYLHTFREQRLQSELDSLTQLVHDDFQDLALGSFDLILLEGALAGISSSGFEGGDGADGGSGDGGGA